MMLERYRDQAVGVVRDRRTATRCATSGEEEAPIVNSELRRMAGPHRAST